MPDASKASFLREDTSQILALCDALASGRGSNISAVFAEVAHSRGLAEIAREANISVNTLLAAVADPANPDIGVMTKVVGALLRNPLKGGDHLAH